MILVTGATGPFGKAVIDFLLQKGVNPSQVAALARDVNKAADLKYKGIDVRIGNYDDYGSLVNAFKGIDKLLFVSGNDVVNRLKQHHNVVDAAKEAGIKHIIYTSFARKSDAGSPSLGILATSHIETDKYIKASGIPYTILQNGLYAESLLMFLGDKVLETGVVYPAGNGRAAYVTRNDLAEAAANVVNGTEHENKEYVLANAENYTLHDVAKILSEESGKELPYIDPKPEDYIETITNAGVPKEVTGMLAGFAEAIKTGEFEASGTYLEKLLGRKPTTLKEYLKSILFG